MSALEALPNFGYYLPRFRALNESHCTTIVDFENGDIQEDGLELSELHRQRARGLGSRDGGVRGGHGERLPEAANPVYFAIDALLQRGCSRREAASRRDLLGLGGPSAYTSMRSSRSRSRRYSSRETPPGISSSAITSRAISAWRVW